MEAFVCLYVGSLGYHETMPSEVTTSMLQVILIFVRD